jgi:hypothetical protein
MLHFLSADRLHLSARPHFFPGCGCGYTYMSHTHAHTHTYSCPSVPVNIFTHSRAGMREIFSLLVSLLSEPPASSLSPSLPPDTLGCQLSQQSRIWHRGVGNLPPYQIRF